MTEPESYNRTDIRALTAVSRAAGELRRGRAVIVLPDGQDGDTGAGGPLVVRAAETLSDQGLAEFVDWGSGPPALALTPERAQVLAMPRPVTAAVLVTVAQDWRADAVQALADPTADLGHPLRGPFARAAEAPGRCHEAALALCKAAQLLPAALAVPVPEAAVGDAITEWAAVHDLLIVDTAQIEAHQAQDGALTEVAAARLPLSDAAGAADDTIHATIHAFRPGDGGPEHLAIVIGDPARSAPVLARIHSECFTGDLLGSLRCDCGQQLRGAISEIEAAGGGVLLYLAQEGRGIGLINKLRAYALQDQGFDTVEANLRLGFAADERVFVPAATVLRALGFGQVRLMTNNPDKVTGLELCGLEVIERVPHAFPANDHNAFYLSTKANKAGHLL